MIRGVALTRDRNPICEFTDSLVDESVVKVWLIQPTLSPYWKSRIRSLSEQKNIELTICLEREELKKYTAFQAERLEGVRTVNLRSKIIGVLNKKNVERAFSESTFWSIPWRLTIELILARPDVVLVCNASQAIFAWFGRWLGGYKIVVMVEDTVHATKHLGRVRAALKRFAYKRGDAWTTFGRDSSEYLSSIGIRRKIFHVPWSIETQSLQGLCLQEQPKIKLTFVGRLSERKGVMLLLEAWSKVPNEVRESCELNIVGDGHLRPHLEDFVVKNNIKNVSFKGSLPHNEVIKALLATDIFVFPSLEDLYGIALLEAASCGCAMIGTPFAGGSELIDDENGWVIDPQDTIHFSNVLRDALSSRQRLREMGIVSRQRVAKMSHEIVMEKFATVLRHVVL